MLKHEVSFVVIPHSTNRVRTKKISVLALRIIAGVAVVVVLGLGYIIFRALRVHYQVAELHYLKARNRQLETRVGTISEIEKKLARLEKEDSKIKRMLGIDKTPPPIDLTQLVFTYKPIPEIDTGAAAESAAANRFIPTIPPTIDFVVSKTYTQDHPGIDLAAALGSPAFSTAAGVVKEVGWDSIYGNYIILRHGDDCETFYGHLERTNKARGDSIKIYDIVGFVGSTGLSSGPHLHFEIRQKGKKINPAGMFRILRP